MKRILLTLAFVLCTAHQGFAWGLIGHAVVAEVAERRLSPSARKEVDSLLATEKMTSLSQISLWADLVKYLEVPNQPSHVVKLPLDDSGYDPATVCKNNRCAVQAIDTYAAILRDRSKPRKERMRALKYIVHLVGDLHQPLHATADNGVTVVKIGGKKQRLHEVWDDTIIQHASFFPWVLVKKVDKGNKPVDPSTPAGWAIEGRNLARDVILKDDRLKAGNTQVVTLPKRYLEDNWPIVRTRLREAGYRLAYVLNDALGSQASTR
jgi:hypothetical protein